MAALERLSQATQPNDHAAASTARRASVSLIHVGGEGDPDNAGPSSGMAARKEKPGALRWRAAGLNLRYGGRQPNTLQDFSLRPCCRSCCQQQRRNGPTLAVMRQIVSNQISARARAQRLALDCGRGDRLSDRRARASGRLLVAGIGLGRLSELLGGFWRARDRRYKLAACAFTMLHRYWSSARFLLFLPQRAVLRPVSALPVRGSFLPRPQRAPILPLSPQKRRLDALCLKSDRRAFLGLSPAQRPSAGRRSTFPRPHDR